MPVSSQKTKKESHSQWVRKRNFRRMATQSQVSRPSSSEPVMAMVDSSDNTKEIRSTAQKAKPKGWLAAMKNVFAGRGER